MKLKGELVIYKVALGNKVLASGSKQRKMDVFKLKEFKGTRSVLGVDNYFGDRTILSCNWHRG